ncbi:MAG TPA: hypothetical protein VHV57_14030 [Acidimicrobiales bacterium]|nr:hypothetical protein [Acidimicrobiales bacterium]
MKETLEEQEAATRVLDRQLRSELARLDKSEENLIDLAAEGSLTTPKVAKRLAQIAQERAKVEERFGGSIEHLSAGAELLEGAIQLLNDAKGLYLTMNEDQRRQMNQAVFEKLYVLAEQITGVKLTEPFDALIEAQLALKPSSGRGRTFYFRPDQVQRRVREGIARESLTTLLLDHGWNKPLMVEVKGFEPSASTLRMSGSRRYDQVLSEDFPGSGVSIPSGSLTIPLLPSR